MKQALVSVAFIAPEDGGRKLPMQSLNDELDYRPTTYFCYKHSSHLVNCCDAQLGGTAALSKATYINRNRLIIECTVSFIYDELATCMLFPKNVFDLREGSKLVAKCFVLKVINE